MTTRDDAKRLRDRGMRQADIAAELGISQPRVSRLLSGRSGNEARTVTHTTHNEPPAPTHTTHNPDDASVTHNELTHTTHNPDDASVTHNELTHMRTQLAALRAELAAADAHIAGLEALPASTSPDSGPCPGCAERDAAYDQLEADRDRLARRLAAWEEPA